MLFRSRSAALLVACALGSTVVAHADARPKARPRLRHVSLTEAAAPDVAPPRPRRLVHTIERGESWQAIAERYLDRTSVYAAEDLARAIVKENLPATRRGPTPGLEITIPHVRETAPRRGPIGLPADGVVKGLYVRGATAAGHGYTPFLDRVAAHGMNAIVLDVKDYDGLLTFPSRVPLANESGAVKKPPIRSYARAVQFAHERGLRVVARISCFNDQLMAKAHPGMAIRGISGHVYRNGWLDPKSERAQEYVLDLVKEAIDNGADEVQLDYVRFPVIGMKNIDYGLDLRANPNAKVEVITSFVERVHRVTRAHGVPLSLDVFGVIAFGKESDIHNLGQDPGELAKHSEFLSPMVYPSHFDAGFMGLEAPADHPELVGMGVRHMGEEIAFARERDGAKGGAKIRPWVSAMRHTASNYGAGYIQEELRTSDKHGGSGWLLWNPGQVYDVAWSALPRRAKEVGPPREK